MAAQTALRDEVEIDIGATFQLFRMTWRKNDLAHDAFRDRGAIPVAD
jgi:hypothetical protein